MTRALPHDDDVQAATTTEELADLFDAAFPDGPNPGERYDPHELLRMGGLSSAETEWLQRFIPRWDALQDAEDFKAAMAARGEA